MLSDTLAKAASIYKGREALRASDIAEVIEFVLSGPAHVNIADTLVLPAAQASSTLVMRNAG